jgi:hypothetical protein
MAHGLPLGRRLMLAGSHLINLSSTEHRADSTSRSD